MRIELIVLLTIQAAAFLVFIVCAFRWLFALRRDAVARSGSIFPGLGAVIGAFREGLIDPRYTRLRLGLAGAFLVLIGTALLVPVLMQT